MGDINRTLTANEGQEVAAKGGFIFVASSTGEVEITVDGETEKLKQGDAREYAAGFNGFRLTDASGAANTVRLVVGEGVFRRSEVSGSVSIDPGGVFDSVTDQIIFTSSSTTIAANSARKKLLISSLDTNTVILRVGDSGVGSNNGILLHPGATIELETSAEVRVYNPSTTALQTIAYAEIES